MQQKKIQLIVVLLSFIGFSYAQKTIEVINQYPFDRENEMVEIAASEFSSPLNINFALVDEDKNEVPYQLIYNGKKSVQSIIFPVNIKTGSKNTYTFVRGKATPQQAATAAFQNEEKHNFVWENDIAAYKVSGATDADANANNGISLLVKNTAELSLEALNNSNEGGAKGKIMDCYEVGNSLGAGGISPIVNGELVIGKAYEKLKIMDNGPLRTSFALGYLNVDINGKQYQQKVIISIDAGSVMNKAVVSLEGEKQEIQLAAGLFLHKGKGSLQKAAGLIIYGEDAVFQNEQNETIKTFAGIITPEDSEYKIQKMHALLISNYTVGEKLVYYFGGAGQQQFATQKDWLTAVQDFNKKLKYPLTVRVLD